MTWEEALKYAEETIDEDFARHGLKVEITDPKVIATTVRLLRIGRRNYLQSLG